MIYTLVAASEMSFIQSSVFQQGITIILIIAAIMIFLAIIYLIRSKMNTVKAFDIRNINNEGPLMNIEDNIEFKTSDIKTKNIELEIVKNGDPMVGVEYNNSDIHSDSSAI